MRLVPWLLALHLMSITMACAVALDADCDGPRLRAFYLAFMIVGWATALSSAVLLAYSLIKGRIRTRDIVLLLILVLIGLDESRLATRGWKLFAPTKAALYEAS